MRRGAAPNKAMPVEGLEPTSCCQERILNPSRDFTSQSTAGTYKSSSANTSSIPSSQAQETRVSEPYLTSIEQALGELSGVERDAVAQHINALATMSKKRRHAILTLTEEEA